MDSVVKKRVKGSQKWRGGSQNGVGGVKKRVEGSQKGVEGSPNGVGGSLIPVYGLIADPLLAKDALAGFKYLNQLYLATGNKLLKWQYKEITNIRGGADSALNKKFKYSDVKRIFFNIMEKKYMIKVFDSDPGIMKDVIYPSEKIGSDESKIIEECGAKLRSFTATRKGLNKLNADLRKRDSKTNLLVAKHKAWNKRKLTNSCYPNALKKIGIKIGNVWNSVQFQEMLFGKQMEYLKDLGLKLSDVRTGTLSNLEFYPSSILCFELSGDQLGDWHAVAITEDGNIEKDS